MVGRNPGLSLRSNPGLKLANAFGVILLKQPTLLLSTQISCCQPNIKTLALNPNINTQVALLDDPEMRLL